jgi:hypothetical protein
MCRSADEVRCLQGAQMLEAADGMDALEMLSYRAEPAELSARAGALVNKYYGEVRGRAGRGQSSKHG